jgi:hypothetical protein
MIIYEGFENLKNANGDQLHPIDGFTWFQTEDKERDALIVMFDLLCGGDDAKRIIAEELISELRRIACDEYAFDRGE